MSELFILFFLILLNGFLALSEITLISVKKSFLLQQSKKGKKSAKMALKLTESPERFLSTIQIGITLIGILTGLYSGDVLAKDFGTSLLSLGLSAAYALPLAQALIILLVTYLSLTLGELIPKKIGLSFAQKSISLVAPCMYFLSLAGAPFVWVLSRSSQLFFRWTGLPESQNRVTEDEIKLLLEEGSKDGALNTIEKDLLDRVLLLSDVKINSLMTRRSELIWFDLEDTPERILALLKNHPHHLYPVARKNLDTLLGIVTLKDLIVHLPEKNFNLSKIIRSAPFFPENMTTYKALEQLKASSLSHALICDEFGALQGLVTLKNILEAFIGGGSPSASKPSLITPREDGESWLIEGQCPFHDFLSYFEQEELYPLHAYTTLSGLLLEQFEHIPQEGEVLLWKNFRLEVIDRDGARIDKILASLLPPKDLEGETQEDISS